MQDAKTTTLENVKKNAFPFALADIDFWIVRRKSGETVRYRLDTREGATTTKKSSGTTIARPAPAQSAENYYTSLSRWCDHFPSPEPVFAADGIELRIADAKGTREEWAEHDLVIDAGNILSSYEMSKVKDSPLTGDAELVKALNPLVQVAIATTRILKIQWADRAAAPVPYTFWPALVEEIKKAGLKRIVTACQGGHGRSGTSLVCLMMVLSDYSALDAITHLRAVHCARAIESSVQHEYIDGFAKFLGRKADAVEAKDVKDFRARFMQMTSPFAKDVQARLIKEVES